MLNYSKLSQATSVGDAEFAERLRSHGSAIERLVGRLCKTCPELLEDARQEAWLTLATLRLENAVSPRAVVVRAVGWRVCDFLRKYNPRGYWAFDRAWSRGYRFIVNTDTGLPILQACRVKQKSRYEALHDWMY